jgi:2-haloacid dehalogenase
MPAHADASPALAHVHKQGAKVYALTNSAKAPAEDALEAVGLRKFLTDVLSVETVRAFKPDARVYEMAVRAAHDVPSKTWLISAHWWDCMGAARQGWKTALVVREAKAPEPAMINPTASASSLRALVDLIAPAESPAL